MQNASVHTKSTHKKQQTEKKQTKFQINTKKINNHEEIKMIANCWKYLFVAFFCFFHWEGEEKVSSNNNKQ